VAFQKECDFKEVTIDYRSNGSATFQFYTDLPGGSLAARLGSGFTLPTSGGITSDKTITIALDGIQGTLFYPLVTPGATTQIILLRAKLWWRPIGVYLDGSLAIAEEWLTQPLALGA